MSRKSLLRAGYMCALSGLLLTGCARIKSYFAPAAGDSNQVQEARAVTPTPTPSPTPRRHHKKRARPHSTTKAAVTVTATPAVTPSASPSPTPAVSAISMTDDDNDRRRVGKLIADNARKLSGISPEKLTRAEAQDYQQAEELNGQAREAAGRHDYLAAQGLADKAALLSSKLRVTASSPVGRGS